MRSVVTFSVFFNLCVYTHTSVCMCAAWTRCRWVRLTTCEWLLGFWRPQARAVPSHSSAPLPVGSAPGLFSFIVFFTICFLFAGLKYYNP